MGEIISTIATGFSALLELIFYYLVFLVRQSVTLIGYVCSNAYREQKNAEWGNQHFRKKFTLGFSGICLLGLIAFCVWTATMFSSEKKHAPEAGLNQNQMRFELHAKDKNGRILNVAIKDGGVSNMMTARSLKDLAKKAKENLVVVGETNPQTASFLVKFQGGVPTK